MPTNEKTYILKNLIMAVLPVFLYNIVSYGFFAIYSYMAFDIFGVSEEKLYLQSSMIDSLSTWLLFFIFVFWLWKSGQATVRKEKLERNQIAKATVLTFGFGGISILWLTFAEDMLNTVSVFSESMQSFDETWATTAEEPYFWVLMSVVIIGPIVEELLFRGLVFQYLERVKKGWFPIVLSGLAFGLWHEEPVQVVYTALMGIGLGIVYAKTRDLRLVMAIHICNNFLSTLPPVLDTDFVQEGIYYISLLMIIPTLFILWKMCAEMKESRRKGL